MTDLRDLSRLPVDPGYWDDLAARITGELGPRVRDAARRPAWWAPLAARAWPLGGLACAALLAALLLVPPRPAESTAATTGLLRPPPGDSAVAAFVRATAPPGLTSLVLRRQQ